MHPGVTLETAPGPALASPGLPPFSDPGGPLLALVGPPNCGKTTLFNSLTGSRYHTANYPGATVEYSLGSLVSTLPLTARVLDLPGIWGLVARSPDEEVSVRALFGNGDHGLPDLVVAVVDVTQLSRHLYLASQVRDSGFRMVLAVTMVDLLARRERTLDVGRITDMFGCPAVPVDPRTGQGLPELVACIRATLARPLAGPLHAPLTAPSPQVVKESYRRTEDIESKAVRLRMAPAESTASRAPAREPGGSTIDPITSRIDGLLLHPLLGPLAALVILGTLFAGVFWLAQPLMDRIDGAANALADAIVALSPTSFVAKLVADGMIRGVGAVLVFVPQIAILFLGMGLLEDSGYLARAAMLVDRPMSALGLNGRSLVPLLSGFACAIPGMMAARTVPNRRERLLTIFIMPLMSCSARLPVFALLLAFLVPRDRPWLGGLAMAVLYLTSMITGAVGAGVASRLMGREGDSTFALELPVYRMPVLRHIVRSTMHRTSQYLSKAGPIILLLSTVLWLGTHLPAPSAQALAKAGATTPAAVQAVELEGSIAARAGHALEPVMKPLGLDWRVGVAMIAAFAAREVFVSTMAILFHVTGDDDDAIQGTLRDTLRLAKTPEGVPLFTVATSAGLVVFFLFALQCLSTVVVSRRETGGWTMPIVQTVTFTTFAYVAAVVTVQGLRMVGVN